MKFLRTTLLTLLFTVFLVIFQQNYVMTNSSSAPTNRTGSPGDNGSTCQGCHSTFGLNSGNGSVNAVISQNGNVVMSYMPNATYDVEVSVAPLATRYGFSMTVEAADASHHGTWTAGANTSIKGTQSEYIGHVSASSSNPVSTWTFQWTAPSSDVGELTFYVVGNEANGSGTSGDRIYTNSITLMPEVVMPTCNVPTGLTKTDTANGVMLSWEDNGADEYQLAGRKLGGNPKVFPSSQNTSRSFDAAGLQSNTTYEWSVRAICDGMTTDLSLIHI